MSKLETNTIDTVSGTSTLQVGSTNTSTITLGVSGDTINVPSGVTINNNGTQTGFGGTNTPAFKVYANSAQSLSSGVTATVVFGAESYDTDNAFASNKFTVPSGKAGKYTFTSSFYSAVNNGTLSELLLFITKNGSSVAETAVDFRNNNDGSDNGIVLTTSLDLAVSDYIETKVYIVATSPAGRSGENYIYFTGHKLIT